MPARILVFGDESSRLEGAQGLKYSINGISPATRPDRLHGRSRSGRRRSPTRYGLVFANCNPNASFDTDAIDNTTVNGTVADVVQKVAAFQAGDTFNGNDLVTIWVGMNDILNDYQANASRRRDRAAGGHEASRARRSPASSTRSPTPARKVLMLTVPDMSYSPFGYTEAQRGDFDRAKLLSDMSTQFNLGLRSNILNDGSKIGLVLVDDLVRNAVRSPGSFGLIALANQTLRLPRHRAAAHLHEQHAAQRPVDGPAGARPAFMWADATHLGSTLQAQIGSQAVGPRALESVLIAPRPMNWRASRASSFQAPTGFDVLRRSMWPSHDVPSNEGLLSSQGGARDITWASVAQSLCCLRGADRVSPQGSATPACV